MKIASICPTLFLACASMSAVSAQTDVPPTDPPDKTTVIVRSAGTRYTPSGPEPEFSALDQDGNASISKQEAKGYKLLANDFLKADSDENGSISESEYARWAAQP